MGAVEPRQLELFSFGCVATPAPHLGPGAYVVKPSGKPVMERHYVTIAEAEAYLRARGIRYTRRRLRQIFERNSRFQRRPRCKIHIAAERLRQEFGL